LVEQQRDGHSYRLLYLNGRLIDAIRRDPPVLVGDGSKSIRQLVRGENRTRLGPRFSALSPLKIDNDAINWLRRQGLSARSRPAAAEQVQVKQVVNENSASQNHRVFDAVHPTTAALGSRLVSDLGLRFVGIDVICKDIGAPLDDANGCIGEINTTPGLHHHYLVADETTRAPVAQILLEEMFGAGQGVVRVAPQSTDRRSRQAA
jgi:cyanophycin synthetase